MTISTKLQILAGAVALAIGGTAMANTAIDETTAGSVILNIVDISNSSSFLFDTGLTQASFSGTGNYSFNFSTDANYTSFLKAGDVLEYSVVSAIPGTVFFTAASAPVAVVGANITQAATGTSGFAAGANATASATTNSALLSGSAQWGAGLNEGLVSTNLLSTATGLGAAPGTALSFYSEVTVNPKSATILANLTTFAGSWNLNGGVLTYSAGATTVPLPTPLLLLLSGLGLMGVVARRGKGASADFMPGAAA
jgi:hypothetical protein